MRPRFKPTPTSTRRSWLAYAGVEPAIDFRSAGEGGVIGRPDPEVLAQAASEGRVLVSHDRPNMPGHFRRSI